MQRIEDEKGRRWVVFEGDPAYETVTKLEKKGYRYIVLPTDYFVGVRNQPTEYEVDGWAADAHHEFEMGEALIEQLGDAMNALENEYYYMGVRYLQLSECLNATK